MNLYIILILFFTSLSFIYCLPLKRQLNLLEDNSIRSNEISGPTSDVSDGMSKELSERTLTVFTFQEYWKAKGEMKIAFLKFLIYKLRIMIRFVAAVFGLRPNTPQRPQNQNYNQMINPYNNYVNPYQQNPDYNDYFQFQLLPEDFNQRSQKSLKAIYDWFSYLPQKVINFLRFE